LILLSVIGLLCPRVVADEWNGWRGLGSEGRSQCSEGPSYWSPDKNILWKTPIPGEGHSSPIVSQDAVYLTTAYQAKQDIILKSLTNYAQLGGILLLAGLAIYFIVHCCQNLRDNPTGGLRRLGSLTALAFIVAALCAFVLFAEQCFNFERCSIRSWIATSIFVSICLVLCAFYTSSQSRLRLGLGISLLFFAAFVAVGFPAKDHALRHGFLGGSAKVMYATIGLPGLIGLGLLSLYLSGSRGIGEEHQGSKTPRPRSWLRSILKWGTIICAGLMLLMLAQFLFRQFTYRPESLTGGASYYEPAIRWWIIAVLAGMFALFVIIRLKAGNSFLANLGVIIGALPFCLISILALSEHIIARSAYLSYMLGTPKLEPILGWWFVGIFMIACFAMSGFWVIAEMRRHGTQECKLPPGFRIVAVFMAVLYFTSANYLTKSSEFVRAVVCIDRTSGTIKWICEGLPGPKGQLYPENSAATPTPVTDGKRIYAYFGTAGLLCTNLSGETIWTCRELPYETVYGVAISPVLCDDKIIILSDSNTGTYIAALSCKTGDLLWKTDRRKKIDPNGSGNSRTPFVKEIGGRKIIVVAGHEDISGYDPLTDQELWSYHVESYTQDLVASTVSDHERLYLSGKYEVLALEIDRLGNRNLPVSWREKISGKSGPNVSSPVVKNGLLFMISDSGIAHCLDAESGKRLWRKKLKGQYFSSLVAIGDQIYFCNTRGLTTIVACDKTYRIIAENNLREQTYTSFAIVDGKMFIRTKNHLYCVHEQ